MRRFLRFGLEMRTGAQFGIGFVDPSNPYYDRGHCDRGRTHLANLTVGAQTPEFGNAALRAVASNWRISGILNARSGSWLNGGERPRQRVQRHGQPAGGPGLG